MAQFEVLIVGIGNILWADEGFGFCHQSKVTLLR